VAACLTSFALDYLTGERTWRALNKKQESASEKCKSVQHNSRIGTLRQALVEAVNTSAAEKRMQCPVDRVKLYLAKSGGAWLPSCDSRVRELNTGAIPNPCKVCCPVTR